VKSLLPKKQLRILGLLLRYLSTVSDKQRLTCSKAHHTEQHLMLRKWVPMHMG
jgi:hypothetical protein